MSEAQELTDAVLDQSMPGHVLIELSRRSLVNHFVMRDMDAACEFMDDHIDWIGPFECQVASSLQEMREILKPEYDTKMALANEQWKAKRYGSVWIVSGMYTVLSQAPESGSVLTFCQRATYVWMRTSESPRIVYLHVSNTTDDNPIAPPLEPGMNAVKYLYDNFDAQSSRGAKLKFRDIEGCVHFLHRNEILCVMSEGPRCRIHHTQSEFVVRGALEKYAEVLGSQFVRVHRSCVVNKSHVVEVENLTLSLDDGFACPVAKKRLTAVRDALDVTASQVK